VSIIPRAEPGLIISGAMTGYVIKDGKPGYDRLALLARERRPDTGARCHGLG
jgi:hypothetical protein